MSSGADDRLAAAKQLLDVLGEAGSAERLQRLVATSRDAVMFIDRQGTILLANRATCDLFGYEFDELSGADVRMLMAEPYASNHQGYIARYEQTGAARAIGRIREVAARHKSGREFPIELSVTQISDSGEGARYGAFIRDVSDKVRLQGELMQRERQTTVGTTASMLVHEIGNPLNNMALQLEALRRRVARLPDAEGPLEKVDSCLSEVERLSRLVQEFRALTGRRRLMRRPTVMSALVESVATGLGRPDAAVVIVRSFEDSGQEILVDPDKLRQVVLNLCHNAVEAMPDGGALTLHTTESDSEFVLEVADTGSGVPPGVDVFEPFVTTKSGGTGLGLAICSEIVKEHGGTLTYETAAGSGTTFRVRLPRADATPAKAE